MQLVQIIKALLAVLPDSRRDDDESWGWCWEELSGDAQEQVKEARRMGAEALKYGRALSCGKDWNEVVKALAHLYEVHCQSSPVDDRVARDGLIAAYDKWLG